MTEQETRLMIDMEGETALVTGGSRGIGRACCMMLGRAGAAVAVHYREAAKEAEEVVAALRAIGSRALAVRGDLSREEDADQVLSRTISAIGAPTILVNNAGIWEGRAIDELEPSAWDRTMSVNMRSMFLCTRLVVPAMKRSGRGSIVNVASTAGQRGEAFHSDYAASKGAAIAFTRSLATELAPFGIRVNCVAPGWVDTDMNLEPFARGGRERIEKTIPLGRVGLPEEIASAVVFAASGLASFMTGSVLSVNGGAVAA